MQGKGNVPGFAAVQGGGGSTQKAFTRTRFISYPQNTVFFGRIT